MHENRRGIIKVINKKYLTQLIKFINHAFRRIVAKFLRQKYNLMTPMRTFSFKKK